MRAWRTSSNRQPSTAGDAPAAATPTPHGYPNATTAPNPPQYTTCGPSKSTAAHERYSRNPGPALPDASRPYRPPWLNTLADEENEPGICIQAIGEIADYVLSLPCVCLPGYDGEPCGRCRVLGLWHSKPVTRGEPTPLSALKGIRGERSSVEFREYVEMQFARAAGATWDEIADACGLDSAKAAQHRYRSLEKRTGQ